MEFQFQFLYFFIGIVLGSIYVFFNVPKPRSIIKYPTPYNTKNITYKSLTGDCYKVKKKQVQCTDNSIEQPII